MKNPLLSRRHFMAAASASGLASAAASEKQKLLIGVTDWNLHLDARPDSIQKAAELGFQGVQISFGREIVDGKMPVDRPDVIASYLKLSKQYGVPIDGTCVDRLHDNGLKSDPLAPKWVSDAIRLTRDLKTKVLLVPFFGKWAIAAQSEMARVGDVLRELAPEAEEAGIILGIEDTISAEDNVRILDRARSNNVLVYYDVGNSTNAGFDVAREIRWLGKERICQIHFKDNPHLLGEGTIPFASIVGAIQTIKWAGWINLETDSRKGRLNEDLRFNLRFVQRLLGRA